MILWLTGNSGAGKTTIAKYLAEDDSTTLHLDGDELRESWDFWDLSEDGRREFNHLVARHAQNLNRQGWAVVVSVICPYTDLREALAREYGVKFIYVPMEGDDQIPDKPYEKPTNVPKIILDKTD